MCRVLEPEPAVQAQEKGTSHKNLPDHGLQKSASLHGRGIWLAPGPLRVNASFFLCEFNY